MIVAGDAVRGERLGGAIGRGAGGGDLAGEVREVVLHRLELGDRPAELDAVERVLHRLVEDAFERAGHLLGARGGGDQGQPGRVEAGRRLHVERGRAVKADRVARLAAEADAGADREALGRDQRDDRLAVARRDDRDVLGVAGERHVPRAAAKACRRRRS